MEGIRQWIEAEGSGHWFFIAFPAILLALFIWFKGRRVRFLIPSLLISIIIINPLFFKYWDELGLYAYWRILWVIPVIPVVAGLVPSLTERIQKTWVKTVVAAVGVGLVAFGGTFLYNGAGGSFGGAANASKLPDYVVQIADRLLELDEHPRVIAQDPIGVYIRQYMGEIDTLYGRDIYGTYILEANSIAKMGNRAIIENDADRLSRIMLDESYNYCVIYDDGQDLDSTCLHLVDRIYPYGIYEAKGKPQLVKTRNELGQVISITTVNDYGQPRRNEIGYSTISYAYDKNGYICKEFHTDEYGKGVLDDNRSAGFERELGDDGQLKREINLGVNGEPSSTLIGYTEYRREYKEDDGVRDLYYDVDGLPFYFLGGYSGKEEVYRDNILVSRLYLSSEGIPLKRDDGYAKAVWTQADDSTWRIHFEDLSGNEVDRDGLNLVKDLKYGLDGWSPWMTPKTNEENVSFIIGNMNLGEKKAGDHYTCQIEVEFKNVSSLDAQSFRFWTQGAQDGKWFTDNVWNPSLINLNIPPKDGVYKYISTVAITESMTEVSTFNIGFRCDNWASGSFRVKNLKVEVGDSPTEWSPGV